MIEPSQAYTVQTSKPMPPAPQANLRIPMSEAFYAIALAEDAKRIRKRHGSRFGHHNSEAARNDANEARRAECEARREKLAGEILGDLRKHPLTTAEIIKRRGVTENAAKQALKLLKERNHAVLTRVGRDRIWQVPTAEKAHAAYVEASLSLHGEFGRRD